MKNDRIISRRVVGGHLNMGGGFQSLVLRPHTPYSGLSRGVPDETFEAQSPECAFVQRITSLPWLGTPFQNDTLQLLTAAALSTTGAQTNSLTGITPTFTRGAVRVKIYGAGGTTPAIVNVQVVVTDGTTFVGIGTVNPTTALALSAVAASGSPYTNGGNITSSVITGGGYDWLFPFCVDINCNQLSLLTTLSGTNPTAKMDVELAQVS